MTDANDKQAVTSEPAAQSERDRLRAQLKIYMDARGLRSTGQRRHIVECFFDCGKHLTIDELLEVVRKGDSGIGYATVYRTMKMLTAGGVALEHKFHDGMTRYELADDETHHDHLICVRCGRIQEFEESLIEELQERIAKQYGFTLVDHKHELYGICADGECKGSTKPEAGTISRRN